MSCHACLAFAGEEAMGTECKRRPYDVSMSRRTRKALISDDPELIKTYFPVADIQTEYVKEVVGYDHKSLKELMAGETEEVKNMVDDKKEGLEPSEQGGKHGSLGNQFALPLVKHQEERPSGAVKCNGKVSPYVKFLSRLIKIKRKPLLLT